ncbi:MAG: hypothetical protein A4E19_03635 [Nitrospira sp. SG-bin1]|nr:MAG: hypothetical protein A4E19_03635 [Nitrospira sp. SG-bin1]
MDERKSTDDLGVLGSHVVEGRHVIPWLQRTVNSLNSPGMESLDRKDDLGHIQSLDIQVGLAQLHVHSLQSSFAANILLKVRYLLHQDPPQPHQY